jgi:3-oxoacyl-[acyl-carrier-protein] synthase II
VYTDIFIRQYCSQPFSHLIIATQSYPYLQLIGDCLLGAATMAARRVAVVGLGTVNPLAATAASTWERLCLGHSGIRAINDLDNYIQLGIPARVAGEVQSIADSQYGLNDSLYSSVLPKRKLPRGIHFGMIAAYQALEHAQLLTTVDGKLTQTTLQPSRVGVAIGTGISGVHELLDNHDALNTRGYRRVSPYLIPNSLVNMTAGLVSMQYNLQGPNHAVSTACSTGAHAIGMPM